MGVRAETISRTYRFAMAACAPLIRWWGRLRVSSADLLPRSGPLLIVGNHDSQWDPVAIGIAGRKHRQIRALTKASLWKIKPLAPILNGMGQIPIRRGAGDSGALDTAIEMLDSGACIGIFPEGTISRGKILRARSGAGRLAAAVPEVRILCARVTGTVDIVRFPKRPRISVEFFEPASGQMQPGEEPAELVDRLLGEIRADAPVVAGGRRRKRLRWELAAAAAEEPAQAQEGRSGTAGSPRP